MSAIVLGGGLAGASAACLLARAGRPVRLIERSPAAMHKICGEFLSREAQLYLAGLGLDLAALGAEPLTHLRLVHGTRSATRRLPFPGLSLTRRALDEALLQQAARCGAEILRGRAARRLETQDGLRLILDDGEALAADRVFLATGKQLLRGVARAGDDNGLIGFKSYFRLAPGERSALRSHVELILYPGGYAGLQPVEGNRANLCLLVSKDRFAACERSWEALLAMLLATNPHLATRLAGATELLPQPLSVAQLPYGFLHRPSRGDPAGVYRLGDQAAITEPFSGDGMSLALHSAHLAVATERAGGGAFAYHTQLSADVGPQIRRAGWLAAAARTAPGRAGLMAAAQALPPLLGLAARWTRLSRRRLRPTSGDAVDLGPAAV